MRRNTHSKLFIPLLLLSFSLQMPLNSWATDEGTDKARMGEHLDAGSSSSSEEFSGDIPSLFGSDAESVVKHQSKDQANLASSSGSSDESDDKNDEPSMGGLFDSISSSSSDAGPDGIHGLFSSGEESLVDLLPKGQRYSASSSRSSDDLGDNETRIGRPGSSSSSTNEDNLVDLLPEAHGNLSSSSGSSDDLSDSDLGSIVKKAATLLNYSSMRKWQNLQDESFYFSDTPNLWKLPNNVSNLSLQRQLNELKTNIEEYHKYSPLLYGLLDTRINLLIRISRLITEISESPETADLKKSHRAILEIIRINCNTKANYLNDIKKLPYKILKSHYYIPKTKDTLVKGLQDEVRDEYIWLFDPGSRKFQALKSAKKEYLRSSHSKMKSGDFSSEISTITNFFLWLDTFLGFNDKADMDVDLNFYTKAEKEVKFDMSGYAYNKLFGDPEGASGTKPLKIKDGSFLYVIDQNGNLYILEKLSTNYHSMILRGANVLSAGVVRFVGGKIDEIDTNSGHYKPTLINLWVALHKFVNQHSLAPFSEKATVKSWKAEDKPVDLREFLADGNIPNSLDQTVRINIQDLKNYAQAVAMPDETVIPKEVGEGLSSIRLKRIKVSDLINISNDLSNFSNLFQQQLSSSEKNEYLLAYYNMIKDHYEILDIISPNILSSTMKFLNSFGEEMLEEISEEHTNKTWGVVKSYTQLILNTAIQFKINSKLMIEINLIKGADEFRKSEAIGLSFPKEKLQNVIDLNNQSSSTELLELTPEADFLRDGRLMSHASSSSSSSGS